jgi:hypothetical protein
MNARRFAAGLASRWQGYWFSLNGRCSLAICRIAVASALYLSFSHIFVGDYAAYLGTQNPDLYDPDGILNLFGSSPPPAWFFEALVPVTRIATACMFIGLFTRTAMFACLFATCCLCALQYSFMPAWCHGDNVTLLALMVLCFSRAGDALSIDELIRRWRGRPSHEPYGVGGDGYAWAVLLGQFSVALMFFNAWFWKVRGAKFGPGWALSDNLRHILVVQYSLLSRDPPALVRWLLEDEWRYKGAALMNLVCQVMPMVGCLLARRPIVRALCGLCFVGETCGLAWIMGIANYQWLLLYAFFVDWDGLIAWSVSRLRRAAVSNPILQAPPAAPRWAFAGRNAFIAIFAGYYLYVAFFVKDMSNRTYPFTAYPMYCTIWAKRPLSEHQTYEMLFPRFAFDGDAEPPAGVRFGMGVQFNYIADSPSLDALRSNVLTMPSRMDRMFPTTTYRALTVEKAIYQIPAYPAPALPVVTHRAIVGRIDRAKGFCGLVAHHGHDSDRNMDFVDVEYDGLNHPELRLFYGYRYVDAARALDVVRTGNRLYYTGRESGFCLFLIGVRDENLGSTEEMFLGPSVLH